MRRMEDKIRSLCHQIVATKDDAKLRVILRELREAVHLHIESLRARLIQYPTIREKRNNNILSIIPPIPSSAPVKKQEKWMRLCAEASVETDPANMLDLVREINRLLEEKEQRLSDMRRGLSQTG